MHQKDSFTDPVNYRDNGLIAIDSLDRNLSAYPEANNYVIKLPENIRNVDAIELLSLQMTRTETNVNSGNNTFYINDTTLVTLTIGEVSSGANLATDMQTQIRTATSDNNYSVSYTNNRIVISHTSLDFIITVTEGFARLSGIYGTGERGSGTLSSGTVTPLTLTASRGINLKGTPYAVISINDYEKIVSPCQALHKSFITVPMENKAVGDRFMISGNEKENRGSIYILNNNQKNIFEFRVKITRPDGSLYTTDGSDHIFIFRTLRNSYHDYNS